MAIKSTPGIQPSGDDTGDDIKVILFDASGMVGQGVLRECLLDPKVESVLAVGRAMIRVGMSGAPAPILENKDINKQAE
jgi:hypothetical protein